MNKWIFCKILALFTFSACSLIKYNNNKGTDIESYWECSNVYVEPLDFYFMYRFGNFSILNKSKDTLLLETYSTESAVRRIRLSACLGSDTLIFRSFVSREDTFIRVYPYDTLKLEMELEEFNFSYSSDDFTKKDTNYIYGQATSRRLQKVINHGKFFYYEPHRNYFVEKKGYKRINYIDVAKKNKSDTCVITIPREH